MPEHSWQNQWLYYCNEIFFCLIPITFEFYNPGTASFITKCVSIASSRFFSILDIICLFPNFLLWKMTFLITSDQLSTVEDDWISYSKYKIIFSHYCEDLMSIVSLEVTCAILNSLKKYVCIYI